MHYIEVSHRKVCYTNTTSYTARSIFLHPVTNHTIMPRTIYLTPPSISEDHIQEKIVCIRTHRERIFQITSELKDEKLICHNYGHGGAGWTFLFGSVPESIRQLNTQLQSNPSYKSKPICVIGAGCYGLLTAIELARAGHAPQHLRPV